MKPIKAYIRVRGGEQRTYSGESKPNKGDHYDTTINIHNACCCFIPGPTGTGPATGEKNDDISMHNMEMMQDSTMMKNMMQKMMDNPQMRMMMMRMMMQNMQGDTAMSGMQSMIGGDMSGMCMKMCMNMMGNMKEGMDMDMKNMPKNKNNDTNGTKMKKSEG